MQNIRFLLSAKTLPEDRDTIKARLASYLIHLRNVGKWSYADFPEKDNVTALVFADAVLARALGWDDLVPVLAHGFRRGDLRKRGDDLRLACHRAVVSGCIETVRMTHDLARRAAHLKSVAPKLRAKQAGKAVEMFLMRDAVTAGMLPLPDRSARRLCDRLVELGAIRELTGRDMFRIYGL